jgi:hypothetical protein
MDFRFRETLLHKKKKIGLVTLVAPVWLFYHAELLAA